MISFTSQQLAAWMGAFFWPFVRILALLSTAPVFGAPQVPMRVRAGLALAIAVALAPALPAMPTLDFLSGAGVVLLLQQILIGAALGMTVLLVFTTVQFAGTVMGLQMGLGFSSLFDPVQGVQITTLASFLNLLAILLFLGFDGHILLLGVLARSFALLPVSPGMGLASSAWHTLVLEGGVIFSLGLALAAPVVGVLLIANIGMGVLSKMAPQLNIFAVGFPLFFLLGFAALYFLMPFLAQVVRHLVEMSIDLGGAILRQRA